MNITERTKLIMALAAAIICLLWLTSYAEYKFTTADTVGIAWDRPPSGDVVTYYALCIQDTTTGVKSWQMFTSWDTVTCAPKWCQIMMPLAVGHYRLTLYAGNDGGQSEASEPIELWITEPAPKKPCCIILFLKKLFGIEQSAQPKAGKVRWMNY